MSRIYDQLKSLEAGIRNAQGGIAPEQWEREQALREDEQKQIAIEREARERNLRIELRTTAVPAASSEPARSNAVAALSLYPKHGNGQQKYYLAAALLVAVVGLYALTRTRPASEAIPAAPVIPPTQTAAGIPVESVNRSLQGSIRPPQDSTAGQFAQPSVGQSRLAASRLIVRDLSENARPRANESPGTVFKGAEASATTKNVRGWDSRAATIREQIKVGAYAEIATSARMLIQDFPDRWEPWFWLGTAQLALGQREAAETALERASNINPKDARIWVQRAVVEQERGDHAAALRLLGIARDLSPASPQIYLNMGYSNDALGQTGKAEDNYHRFLALTEGNGSYLTQRKSILQRLAGRY